MIAQSLIQPLSYRRAAVVWAAGSLVGWAMVLGLVWLLATAAPAAARSSLALAAATLLQCDSPLAASLSVADAAGGCHRR